MLTERELYFRKRQRELLDRYAGDVNPVLTWNEMNELRDLIARPYVSPHLWEEAND